MPPWYHWDAPGWETMYAERSPPQAPSLMARVSFRERSSSERVFTVGAMEDGGN